MLSKWFKLKESALAIRRRGLSIGKVERRLGIPRSTLSGWFKNVVLTPSQKEKLLQDWKNGLVKARHRAVLWHNAQKKKRLSEAEGESRKVLGKIEIADLNILELAVAILYLGEGTKKADYTAIGSSDPLILKFFLAMLRVVYGIDNKKIQCQLSLRADQDSAEMKRFWARELKLPLGVFKHVAKDARTKGTKTYPDYRGVCQLRCGTVAVQRRLIFLANLFCKKVVKRYLGS